MKRVIALLLALLLPAAGLFGCGGDTALTLEEPRYAGEAANGKPTFDLKWSRAPGAKSYVIAIYAELDGFVDRSEIPVYEGRTRKSIVMLQGVYTDTVTYRIKVRAKDDGAPWSNIWEIRFTDGDYTVSATAADFDPPVTPKPTADPAKTPRPSKAPVAHAFPEPLLEFARKENGGDPVNLSNAKMLQVAVNHCEYGEPVQRITDETVIKNVISALSGITVTGDHDGMGSTETYYGYGLYDGEDQYLGSFAFQGGMLMENEGRYPIAGLDALFSVDGIKLAAEWEEFRAATDEKRNAYDEAFVDSFPLSVFAAGGYDTSLLAGLPHDRLLSVNVRVMWNDDAGRLFSDDPAVVGPIYDALSAAQVTGEAAASGGAQKWTVTFQYLTDAGEQSSADVQFQGDTLFGYFSNSGTRQFAVTGLDALFAAADADVLTYLAEKRNMPQPDPVY